MSDSNVRVDPDSTGKRVDAETFSRAAEDIYRQRVALGGAADAEQVVVTNTTPGGSDYAVVTREAGTVTVTGTQTDALTDTELRATPVPISGTVTASGVQTDALTDTELRATPVPVSGSVTANAGSVEDANNTTATPLGISGTFIPANGTDLLGYTAVCVTLYANVASTTDGMKFQFSTDDTNWDDSYSFTLSAGSTRRFQFPVTAQYFRLNYTNGGTGQAAFRVQTILHTGNQLTSIHRLVDSASPDRSAQVVKAALIAQQAGAGNFVPVQATAGGNLKTSLEEIDGGVLGQAAMALSLPVAIASDQDGFPDVMTDGNTPPGNTEGYLMLGFDGGNTEAILTDSGGRVIVNQGTAAAGSAAWPVNIVDTGNTVVKPGDSGNDAIRCNIVTDGSTTLATAAKQLADGHAVTVDNTTGSPANVQIGDGTSQATVRNLAANDALNVAMVDAAGDHVTSFGGGTQYTEDAPAAGDPTGTAQILVADDTPALEVADGDNVAQRGTRYGAAYSQIVDSSGNFIDSFGGSGGTAQNDNTAVGQITGAGALYDTSPPAISDGNVGLPLMTSGRVLMTDASATTQPVSGTVAVTGTQADALTDTELRATAVPVSGTFWQGTQPVSGTVTADAGTGTFAISAAALPLPSGAATSGGQLAAGHDVTVDNVAGTNPVPAEGSEAHDAAATDNPLLVAGSSETIADSAPTNRVSADGDVGRLSHTDGAVFVIPSGPQQWSYHEDSSNALTDASVHGTPGSGLSLYVTDIVFSTGAATACNVFFEESTTTVLGPYYLEAVAGRGLSVHFNTPKKITANTALTVTTSAAIAHGIDVLGFVAPG